ncbi:phosphoribosylamine--glycine ligase [Mucisphaera calidilacus]|uniref:Phosphoribosylamine--glycine ligase n=1 Tax=Mucisphaera calidilacus TaxID=2527982 RepID=A0A518BZH8_9BACT|nr:phosphoribosylamine--glycine ligase [Mucisphaera calidilacus]QDU72382.1 Phosphoribosylamine--glycine ligase [Mucisphaera calidilacus]
MPTNVLIIGAGGREHAIGWKLAKSKRCGNLFFAPGNGGTAALGKNLDLAVDKVDTRTVDEIDYFCRKNNVSLIVVGPEDPLAAGLVDKLKRTPGAKERRVFGPIAEAARLEADKAWSKQLMRACSVPTADAKTFTDYEAARAYCEARELPVVVKASGLAKGKGVIVCDDNKEAVKAVETIMKDRAFGEAGDAIVVEERLVGQEVSILALVDGQNIYVLEPAQDHKPIGEGDTGPNTGGMGAYTPTPVIDDATMTLVETEVLVPIVDAMRRSDIDFKGVLYAGLMLTAGGPKVLEFNCRFGDPETQPLMMRMQGDLLDLLEATCDGKLDQVQINWDQRCCTSVVMSSGGYPGKYETGIPITGIEEAETDPDVRVFHAGTRLKGGELQTAGGRVLNVCAMGNTLAQAQAKANEACAKIRFEGAYFRKDIGSRVLNPKQHEDQPVG